MDAPRPRSGAPRAPFSPAGPQPKSRQQKLFSMERWRWSGAWRAWCMKRSSEEQAG
jgi:hypothetical protein